MSASQESPRPPVPGPPRRRTPEAPAAVTPPTTWGRVDDDGTVYVRTAEGERSVGQYPEGTPAEALTFFAERYAALDFEVGLLEARLRSGALAPDEAVGSVRTVREQVSTANAVGDLAALEARLDALTEVIGRQREERKAERAEKQTAVRAEKERVVAEAEKLAESSDWRNGANRLRTLLDEWKVLPRLDRAADDTLWRRFSSARTTYTRRRKAHFADQQEKREGARGVKERLAVEAEKLADSTDWAGTASRFRDLMREWKVAGPAQRDVDEALWKRFRGAQDQFFGARDAVTAEQDRALTVNAEAKLALLVEAEALVPVTDVVAAKRAFREIADRWDALGSVPREQDRDLEARMRKVEQAIRGVEDARWKRSDPEKSARADDMVAKLQAAIDQVERDLDAAQAAGQATRAQELTDNLASRRAFLEMAQRAASDFS